MSCPSCSATNNALNTQTGGVKKSNGHKMDCKCPICINIKHAKGGAGYDVDDNDDSQVNAKKKSNGHKANCGCPICKNMNKKSVKGVKSIKNNKSRGLKKRSNGHKANCGCPICKNMNKKNVTMKSGKKKSNGHKANCGCPICKNMRKNA